MPADGQSILQVIDLHNSKRIMTLAPGSGDKTHGMCMDIKPAISGDGSVNLLCGYEDGSIALWDLRTGKETSRSKIHNDTVMCLDYSSDMRKGISGSVDDKIHTWHISESGTITPSDVISITNSGLNCIRIRSDSKIFATAGWDSRIRIYSFKKSRALAVLAFHTQSVQTLGFDPLTNTLAAGSKDSLITVWSIYK